MYEALKEYFKQHQEQEVLVLHSYHIDKKVPEAADVEKDFLILNKTFGYFMNIEVKKVPTERALRKGKEQLENTKALLEDWFGGTDGLQKLKYISVFYNTKDGNTFKREKNINHKFWIFGKEQVAVKMNEIHSDLKKNDLQEDFELLVKNLLFYTTVQQLPIKCNFDKFVDESFQGITAEVVDFWNMTPGQMSLMQTDQKCVLYTSPFSTGKTMLMVAKAKQVAGADIHAQVLFAVSRNIDISDGLPIMLKAKLDISFQEYKNVDVIFVEAGLQPLIKLIEENFNKSIFVDEVYASTDEDAEKLEELAKKRSKYLWIAVTRIKYKINENMTLWLRNQSTFYNPQLSYCMRNSKSIFVEAEANRHVYSVHSSKKEDHRDYHPTTAMAQLPQNVPEGITRSFDRLSRFTRSRSSYREGTSKSNLEEAFNDHPTKPVIIIVAGALLNICTGSEEPKNIRQEELMKDIGNLVASIRKNQPFLLSAQEEAEELVNKAKGWLKETYDGGRQDLITTERFMDGFEWPHIIFIDGDEVPRTNKNIIMRTVSTFSTVQLPVSFWDQFTKKF